jgi:DNA-binding MarR family transcriptional regulator
MAGQPPAPEHDQAHATVIRIGVRLHVLLGERLGHHFYSVPALDMLLDLYLIGNRRPRSLSSLCGASPAPVRTALRTINRMVDGGLLERRPDLSDGRRTNVELTSTAVSLLDGLFEELAKALISSKR